MTVVTWIAGQYNSVKLVRCEQGFTTVMNSHICENISTWPQKMFATFIRFASHVTEMESSQNFFYPCDLFNLDVEGSAKQIPHHNFPSLQQHKFQRTKLTEQNFSCNSGWQCHKKMLGPFTTNSTAINVHNKLRCCMLNFEF